MLSKSLKFTLLIITLVYLLLMVTVAQGQEDKLNPLTIESDEGWRFEVLTIVATEYLQSTDFEPDNGIYVLISGAIFNEAGTLNCINPRNFKLKVGDITFRSLLEEGRAFASPTDSYVIMAQENYCAAIDQAEIIVAVFDVPAQADTISFTLFEQTTPIDIEWDVEHGDEFNFFSDTIDGESTAPTNETVSNATLTTETENPSVTCPSLSATCSQLTCEQAYACLEAGHNRLDRDNDGVPCESICG